MFACSHIGCHFLLESCCRCRGSVFCCRGRGLAVFCCRGRGLDSPLLAMELASILKDSTGSSWTDHNFALKALRHRLLQESLGELTFPIVGQTAVAVNLIQHDAKGPGFEVTDEIGSWSWKDLIAALPKTTQDRIVGTGITGVSVKRRGPKSYDHAFAAVAASKGWTWPGSDKEPPPIVDFAFYRSDGSIILVHPRKKRGQVDIIVEAGVPVTETPAKGWGKSDGPGTFRYFRDGAYADSAFTPGFGYQEYPKGRADLAGGAWSAVADQSACSSDLPVVMGQSGGASVPPQQPPPPPPQNDPRFANAVVKAPPPHLQVPPPPPPQKQQPPPPSPVRPAVAAPSGSSGPAIAAPSSSSGPAVAAPSSSSGPAVAAPSSSSGPADAAPSSSSGPAVAAPISSTEPAVAAPSSSPGPAVAAPSSGVPAVAGQSFYVQKKNKQWQ